MELSYKLKAKVMLYSGNAAWHFALVPKVLSAKIKKTFSGMEAGFGSLKVLAQVGKSVWKTSIFPDTKKGIYMLPLKASVRKTENIKAGQTINLNLTINL